MKRLTVLFLGVSFLAVNAYAFKLPTAVTAVANAQSGSSSAVDVGSMEQSSTNAINTYRQSQAFLIESYENVLAALNMKDEAATLLAEVKSYQQGTLTQKSIEAFSAKSAELDSMIALKLQSAQAPTEEGKKFFSSSLQSLAQAGLTQATLIVDVQKLLADAQSAVTNVSIADVGKVKDVVSTATILTKGLPGDLGKIKNILKSYIAYGKKHEIKTPKDATALLPE